MVLFALNPFFYHLKGCVLSLCVVFREFEVTCVCVCLLTQAHMLVCRALSNMLLLPWPNLPENEQQWPTRSSNHSSLLAALTREYRILRGTVNITPRRPDLNDGRCFFLFHSLLFGLLDELS